MKEIREESKAAYEIIRDAWFNKYGRILEENPYEEDIPFALEPFEEVATERVCPGVDYDTIPTIYKVGKHYIKANNYYNTNKSTLPSKTTGYKFDPNSLTEVFPVDINIPTIKYMTQAEINYLNMERA